MKFLSLLRFFITGLKMITEFNRELRMKENFSTQEE